MWAFGHTHFNCDFKVGRRASAQPLRVIANQRGYYFSQAAAQNDPTVSASAQIYNRSSGGKAAKRVKLSAFAIVLV